MWDLWWTKWHWDGAGFSPSFSVFPVGIIPPLLHINSCTIWGMDSWPVSGRSYTETVSRHRNNNDRTYVIVVLFFHIQASEEGSDWHGVLERERCNHQMC
jgi:hypothetical protein